MIAHNCQFDLHFVYSLLKRHYPYEADEIVSKVRWLDTMSVLKDRKDYPHKLVDAVRYYKIDDVNYHRAIDDTKALYEVALAMKNERDDLGKYINVFGYNPKYGVGRERFSFIEYKSQPYHNRGCLPPERILPRR
jgi:DNA polymerase III alpha subunit (gram-positive type)